MKPILQKSFLLPIIFLLIYPLSAQTANNFTNIIQDFAIQTACLGQYSMAEAGKGWYDDPGDYYVPRMMAERFAKMSRNQTKYQTFYGLCFDYAQYEWEDIEANLKL
ncbi:MAG: hypothetical protein HUK25_04590 [Treponema sp.]|nr:hypothetical protein [Treponema sp.]